MWNAILSSPRPLGDRLVGLAAGDCSTWNIDLARASNGCESEKFLKFMNSRILLSLSRSDGNRSPCAHKQEASQGVRHLYGFAPLPSPDLLNLFKVSTANPEYNLFRCYLL
jgi:hypothetical protein